MNKLFLLFLFVSSYTFCQNDIAVDIHGVPESKGKISVAVYNNEEGFLKFDKVFKCDSTAAKKGVTHIFIEDIPEGEYALAIFYDENGNDKLDTNWLGIPKEKVAFSKGKMKTFGPPKYRECSFQVKGNVAMDIHL